MENNKLKITIGSNDSISHQTSKIFVNQIITKPNSILGFSTGSSHLKLYANIVKAYKEGKVSFKEISTFNLDE